MGDENYLIAAILLLILLTIWLTYTTKKNPSHKSDFTNPCVREDEPLPKQDDKPLPPYINTFESSEYDAGVPHYSNDLENAQLVVDSLNYNVHPHPFITYWKKNPNLIVVEVYKHPASIIGNALEDLVKTVQKLTDEEQLNVKYVYKEAPNSDPNGDSIYKYAGYYKFKYYGARNPNALKEWILSVVN